MASEYPLAHAAMGGGGELVPVWYGWIQDKTTYSNPHSAGMGCQLCPPGSCKQANFCLLTALMVAIPAVNGNQKKSCRERNRQ